MEFVCSQRSLKHWLVQFSIRFFFCSFSNALLPIEEIESNWNRFEKNKIKVNLRKLARWPRTFSFMIFKRTMKLSRPFDPYRFHTITYCMMNEISSNKYSKFNWFSSSSSFYRKPDSSIKGFKDAFLPGITYRMRNLTEMANGSNRFEQKMQSHNVHPPPFYFYFYFFFFMFQCDHSDVSKCVVRNKGTITTKTTNIKCNWLKWMLVVMWNVKCEM